MIRGTRLRIGAVVTILLVAISVAPATSWGQSRSQMQRARQYYSEMMRQRGQMLQKQFEEAQKLAMQRQTQAAAEAAKKLEARKSAAAASRAATAEKHAKAKEYYAKHRHEGVHHNETAGGAKNAPADPDAKPAPAEKGIPAGSGGTSKSAASSKSGEVPAGENGNAPTLQQSSAKGS